MRTQIVAPDEVPVVALGDGVVARVLGGSLGGVGGTNGDPLAASVNARAAPVLLLHVHVAPGAAGTLAPLPAEFNGFLWMLDGALVVGGDGGDALADGVPAQFGGNGLLRLPPGGDALALCNNDCERPARALVALGRPRRKPYYKYVGYGGGFIHSSVSAVEAAMAEYEQDPCGYGRRAAVEDAAAEEDGGDESDAGTAEQTIPAVEMSAYELIGGFQENGGDMMERPPEVVGRFTYARAAPPPPSPPPPAEDAKETTDGS